MKPRLVIIDRDGVLNAESEDHIKSVDEWLPLPGSLEAVARLCRARVRVALMYSPAGPGSEDPRRKPNPGMLLDIAHHCGIPLDGVPFVGDSWRDIEAARAAGARPVLVRTGYGRETEHRASELSGVEVHDDLAAFVDAWLREGAIS